MKDTFYFPHDYNAIQDPKMMQLLTICGPAGVGLYWIIIELLHQQKNGKISLKDFQEYLRFYGTKNLTSQVDLTSVEHMLIKCKLLFKKGQFVSSLRVLDNLQYREFIKEKRSLAGKMSWEMRSKPRRGLTRVKHVLNTCSTAVEQNRTKERKGKENAPKPPRGGVDNSKVDINSQISEFKKVLKWENSRIKTNLLEQGFSEAEIDVGLGKVF